jgi:CelD/BcsL family acetyltransferase involved in cellulose biosynthesis
MVNQSDVIDERLLALPITESHARATRAQVAVTSPKAVIRHYQDHAQLPPEWEATDAFATSPMQSIIWAQACAASFPSSVQTRFITVEQDGRPIAFAPLIKRRGMPRLTLLGLAELCEPAEFLYADATALEHLANAIAEQSLPIWIERAPKESPMIAALEKAYRRRGLVVVTGAQRYPIITLNDEWTTPEQKLNAGRRSDLRRAERHAEKMGAVSYEIHSPDAETCGPLLEEALAVEAASWKGREGSAIACDRLRAPFYTRYATSAAAKGILRLCFLRINGQAAAMQYAVECGRRFWLLKIGYDECFARCSPGLLLLRHTISEAARRGLHTYEFLGGVEAWTRAWAQETRATVSLRAYPFTPLAMATLTADATRSLWARLKKQVRGER